MRRLARPLLLAAALATVPLPAMACTHCDSPDAVAVRAKVFASDFWRNLGAILAPLPLLLVAVAVVDRFGADRR